MNHRRPVTISAVILLTVIPLLICSHARCESPALPEISSAKNDLSAIYPASSFPLGMRRRLPFGPEVGVFIPSSGKTRDRFGDAWLSIGVGFGAIKNVGNKGKIQADYSLLYQTRGDNHAFILPVGLSYQRALARGGSYTPYFGVSANLYITDLRSDVDGIHSRFRFAPGGSAILGVNAGRHIFVEARYFIVDRIRGLDLSGINVAVGYRF